MNRLYACLAPVATARPQRQLDVLTRGPRFEQGHVLQNGSGLAPDLPCLPAASPRDRRVEDIDAPTGGHAQSVDCPQERGFPGSARSFQENPLAAVANKRDLFK